MSSYLALNLGYIIISRMFQLILVKLLIAFVCVCL